MEDNKRKKKIRNIWDIGNPLDWLALIIILVLAVVSLLAIIYLQ